MNKRIGNKVAEGVYETDDGKFAAILETGAHEWAALFTAPLSSLTPHSLKLQLKVSRHVTLDAAPDAHWIMVSVPMQDLQRIPRKRLAKYLSPFTDSATFHPHRGLEQAFGVPGGHFFKLKN